MVSLNIQKIDCFTLTIQPFGSSDETRLVAVIELGLEQIKGIMHMARYFACAFRESAYPLLSARLIPLLWEFTLNTMNYKYKY